MALPEDDHAGSGQHCDETSWMSYLTFRWLNPMLEVGIQRQVALRDSPPMAVADDTLANTRELLRTLGELERSGKDNPLIRAVIQSFWPKLAALQMLNIMSYLLGLLSPFVFQRVLVFQEAQTSGEKLGPLTAATGLTAVFTLIALGIFIFVFNSQRDLFKNRLSVRMNGALKGVVVARGVEGLTRSPGATGDEVAAGSGAAIYNVVSFDVGQTIDIVWILLDVWLFPIQLITALLALFSQVSWAIIPGLATIVLVKGINFVLLFWDGVYRDRLMFAKDERLGRCSEGFLNIRTLHMLAWIPAYEAVIMQARSEELRMQRTRLWLTKIPSAFDYGLVSLVTLVTLGYYIATTGAHLKASLALPVISIIGTLISPIGQIPVWTNQYKVWRSAYDRTNRFMGFEGRTTQADASSSSPPDNSVLSLQGCHFSWHASRDEQISIEDEETPFMPRVHAPAYGTATESQVLQGFTLRDISMQIPAGQLMAVVGKEGQGKSSLLLALLREMPLESGSYLGFSPAPAVQCPGSAKLARMMLQDAAGGSRLVTYASQEPWLFTGSLRSNVLFGLPQVQDLYEKVLEACALKADLATMAADDLTELSACGSTLSGGQRARVGLARAVYAAALELQQRPGQQPLVLLDDPFCALDRAVAAEVCTALLSQRNGLLAGCPIVVATADPWWLNMVLHEEGGHGQPNIQLLVLREGCIVAQGSASDLKDKDIAELKGVGTPQSMASSLTAEVTRNPQDDEEEGEEHDEQEPDQAARDAAPVAWSSQKAYKLAEAQTQTPLTQEQKQKGSLTVVEEREAGHVQFSTYMTYLDSVGYGTFALLVVSLTGIMVFQNFCNLWVVYWTSDSKQSTFIYRHMNTLGVQLPEGDNDMLKVFACLILLFYASNVAGHAMEIIGGIRASRDIFAASLKGTLSRPFIWWDTNPTGRVLNRFSEDVGVMDAAVTNIFGIIIGAVLYFLGHTMVLTLSNPMSLALLPFVAFLMDYFAQYYRNTIREFQRLYLVCMSQVYQEMTEAIRGGVSIRAFSMKEDVFCRCLLNLQELQRASLTKALLSQWVTLRLGMVGFIVSTSNQLYPVLQYYNIVKPQSAALIGFAISYSQELAAIIQQFIMNFSDMEMQLVSIERLKEYAKPEEAKLNSVAALPRLMDDEEVTSGLVLRDVEVTYRSGLKPALAGITLQFTVGQSVAVVGRTGAGKSSLLLSVLQLVPYRGSVKIDGICLQGLSKEARGQLVAIVPQQPVLFAGSLRWNLDPEFRMKDDKLLDVLAAVGLQSLLAENGLEVKLGSTAGTGRLALSSGQKQLLCAARALLAAPKVALLDEVTATLPAESASTIVNMLLKRFADIRATTLLVTHQEDLIPCCDRLVRLAAGRVISDEALR
eukprot:TRINITY_DN1145_c0_g2_i1.p1 TRINITY_DN1145_c0_g2~~TRINITY_DN1145_c0_g2_i1.p1  ORF type:complete len:1380 (+),score=249.14 TRINITY_DN1145_c0_g2_i1:198-4337(+)